MFWTVFFLVALLMLRRDGYGLPVATRMGGENAQCHRSKVLILGQPDTRYAASSGAGMAGISAGKSLTEQGIHDFNIIEYQDRIGGRTLHTKFGRASDGSTYTVELGTNWITGLHGPLHRDRGIVNPLWTLAEEVNLTTLRTAEGGWYFDQHGRSDWGHFYDPYDKAYARLAADANDRVKDGRPDVSANVGYRLAGWDSTNDMRKQAVEALDWDFDAAAPPDLSSLIFGQIGTEASDGSLLGHYERFVLDQRGFDVLARHLANEYLEKTDERLVLDSPITRVIYSDSEVTVHTANNTCFAADYAICTFSLGVLQQSINGQAPVTFSPPFPKWKAEAVLSNIMGIYTKIFFQFKPSDVFWAKHIQNFYYASPTTRGYWLLWESLDFPGSPLEGSGIIFATMVWDQSRRIEQQSDDATMREGLAVLGQMFPNVMIPEPIDFMYPRWGMTPWSFGSYSNWANGYTLQDNVNFRANLGRLWFAGEATSPEFYGYLHGAYYEGQFAAEEVAACINGQDSCADRGRYTDLKGLPEQDYNRSSGFQNRIGKVVDSY